MQQYGLIDAIETLCKTKGYRFFFDEDLNNTDYLLSWAQGQLGITCFFTNETFFNAHSNQIERIVYSGNLFIFCKYRNGEIADLDQTFYQKYKTTLSELPQTLSLFIQDLACENQLNINRCSSDWQVNYLDENYDGVKFDVSFEHVI